MYIFTFVNKKGKYQIYMSNLRSFISKKIKSLRKSRGITQAQLAASLNISREYLSTVETGKSGLSSLEFLEAVAEKLDIDIIHLLPVSTRKYDHLPIDYPALAKALEDPELAKLLNALAERMLDKE